MIRSGHFEALNFSVQDFVAWRRKAERTDLDHILRHRWMDGGSWLLPWLEEGLGDECKMMLACQMVGIPQASKSAH